MKKILIYILVICSLFVALAGCEKYSEFDDSYTIWEAAEDGSTITDGTFTYNKYGELPLGMRVENGYFSYYNPAILNEDAYGVYSSTSESGILYLYNYDLGITVYVKDGEDTEKLDSFLSGNVSAVKVTDYSNYTYFEADTELVGKLDALSGDVVNIAVRKLASVDCYDIVFLNSDGTLAYTHGAIYDYEGELYYVNYDKLGNNYFDSFGNFSFGRGTVDMYKLPEALAKEVSEKIESMDSYSDYITWEDEIAVEEEPSREDAISTIIAVTVILGIVLPLIPLAIGAIALLKKKGKVDTSTYALIAASAVWVIAGIVLMILSL